MPSTESRAIKHGTDPTSLTPLEVRVAAAKKARGSPAQLGAQTAEDACMSDLLKINLMSS